MPDSLVDQHFPPGPCRIVVHLIRERANAHQPLRAGQVEEAVVATGRVVEGDEGGHRTVDGHRMESGLASID